MPDTTSIALYLDRLGLDHAPPSAGALFEIHRAHVERVPYETTWIQLQERWTVDQDASFERIARARRGGYCFHLNGALALLLGSLGYDVTLHRGGVHGEDGPAGTTMDNHLVLTVRGLEADGNPGGDWYVDAGLGDGLYEPLPIRSGTFAQQPFTFGLHECDADEADWQFRHDPAGSFFGMAFRATPARIDEFAERNVALSTSPESGFVKLVTVQRRDAGGVDIMRGLVLRRVGSAAEPERTIDTADEWFTVLNERFDLPLADVSSTDRRLLWERVHATHQAWLAQQP
ncbi:MAG: arylamine N-acetyltransferase protein [Ilumatobacteraceae bacterium]|nr:arylamine N-acetyltransferase protein [Ilumatobacteraceae bacterium]MCU1388737.1 arylamine N-acetyltransferase protein [Ilumatobacteraceae bacterium]